MATVSAREAGAFRSAAFTRFYAGQTLSFLGDGLRTLVLPLLIFRLTGSAVSVGLMWGLELAPFALVGLVGGSLADRVDRRTMMLLCDGLRCAVMVVLCALLGTGHLTVFAMYAAAFALSSAAGMFISAQTPSIPYLLGKDGAKSGVATLQATEQTVNLVAPPLGGALLGAFGPLPALAINAATYLCSQVAIASVASFGPETASGMPSARRVADDIATGWRLVWADATIAATTLFSFCFNTIGTVGYVVLIPYFKRAFGASDLAVGVAFGCFSAGAALGAYLGGRTHWRVGPALVAANFIDGLGWLPTAWTTSMPLAITGIAIASVASGYYFTTIVSWRLRIVHEDTIGRVFAIVRLIAIAGILPGSLAGGWLADHAGVRLTVGISAFGYLALSILMAAVPYVRRERR